MSGGEKQLIAVTACGVSENEIILLDEPSSSLDNEAIDRLKEALIQLKKLGKIIIVVEHRLFYLKNIMDRLCIINESKIDQCRKEEFNDEFSNILSKKHKLRSFEKISKKSLVRNQYFKINVCESSDEKELWGKELSCLRFKKEYYKKRVLDFSLSFDRGINFILGKNGIGKSTFVELLMGTIKGKNEVFYQEEKIKKRNEMITMVMRDVDYQLFTETVWQELSTITEDEEIKIDTLKIIHLYDKKDHNPQSLSGGEKQRLLIAMAMISQKPIIILDEPTSGLDKIQMNTLINFLKKMEKEGRTVIIITHDYEFIKECGGSIYEFLE